MKSIYHVRIDYENGEYDNKIPYPRKSKLKEDHVFDENKSVKWNREEVVRYNKSVDEERIKYREETNRLSAKLHDDIINALVNEYNFTKNQANKIYDYAYMHWHSCMSDFLNNLEELCELIDESFIER